LGKRQAESEIGRKLRSSQKTELASKYWLLVSQCIQTWESCVRECQKV